MGTRSAVVGFLRMVAVVLAVAAASNALARGDGRGGGPGGRSGGGWPHQVPEFDPAAAGAVAALLAGGALTLASRRRTK